MSKHKSIRVSILFLIFFVFTALSSIHAEPIVLPLWQGTPPVNPFPQEQAEFVVNRDMDQNELGLNRSYSFVSEPEMTVHLPNPALATGAAVVIYPGGGYSRVVIDKEGHDVAKVLNKYGIAAIVVKYRTRPVNVNIRGLSADSEIFKAILADGQRAIRLVRYHAKEWGIQTDKIGAMGFSAGGHLTFSVAAINDLGNPDASDPVERLSCRPDFAAPCYPGLWGDLKDLVTGSFPPAFILHASDDKTTSPILSAQLYQLLRENDVPAELHFYAKGGHGFGLGVQGGPVATWPDRFIDWLDIMGFSPKP